MPFSSMKASLPATDRATIEEMLRRSGTTLGAFLQAMAEGARANPETLLPTPGTFPAIMDRAREISAERRKR